MAPSWRWLELRHVVTAWRSEMRLPRDSRAWWVECYECGRRRGMLRWLAYQWRERPWRYPLQPVDPVLSAITRAFLDSWFKASEGPYVHTFFPSGRPDRYITFERWGEPASDPNPDLHAEVDEDGYIHWRTGRTDDR